MYYNQRDYPHVPYPAPGYESATVKSGGCGVCCASMIVESLTDWHVPPEKMAPYCIEIGARVSGGTDMGVLAEGLCRDFGLRCSTTNDKREVLTHLKAGGMAIANVGGDRKNYQGVFSDSGHYLVLCRAFGDQIMIADPYVYAGKYSLPHRKSKVTVQGDFIYASMDTVDRDCENRSPRYYLFGRKE